MSQLPTASKKNALVNKKRATYNFVMGEKQRSETQIRRYTEQKVDFLELYRNTKSILNSRLMSEVEPNYDRYIEIYNQLKTEPALAVYFSEWNIHPNNYKDDDMLKKSKDVSFKTKKLPELGNTKTLKLLFKNDSKNKSLNPENLFRSKAKFVNDKENQISVNKLTKPLEIEFNDEIAAQNVRQSLYADKSEYLKAISKTKLNKIAESQICTKNLVYNLAKRSFILKNTGRKLEAFLPLTHFNKSQRNIPNYKEGGLGTNNNISETKFHLEYNITGNFNDFYNFLFNKRKGKTIQEISEGNCPSMVFMELPQPEFSELEPEIRKYIIRLKNLTKVEKLIYKEISIRLNRLARESKRHRRIIKPLLSPPFTLAEDKRPISKEKIIAHSKSNLRNSKSCFTLKIKIKDLPIINPLTPSKNADKKKHFKQTRNLPDLISRSKYITPKSPQYDEIKPIKIAKTLKQTKSKSKTKIDRLSSIKFIGNDSNANIIDIIPNISTPQLHTQFSYTNPSIELPNKKTGSLLNYGSLVHKSVANFRILNTTTNMHNQGSNNSLTTFQSQGRNNKDSVWMQLIYKIDKSDNLNKISEVGYYHTTKGVNKAYFDVFLDTKEKRLWSEALGYKMPNISHSNNLMKECLGFVDVMVRKIKVDIVLNDYSIKKLERQIIKEENNDAEDFD